VGLTCARILAQSMNILSRNRQALRFLKAGVPNGNYTVYPLIDALRGEVFMKEQPSGKVLLAPVDACLDKMAKLNSRVLIIRQCRNKL